MARPSKKQQIMTVAMQLMAERGVNGVSLREINAEANVSSSALRYHFKNRDDLVAQILRYVQPKFYMRRQLMLNDLLVDKTNISVHSIVEALVLPISDVLRDQPGEGRQQLRFLSRLYFDGEGGVAEAFEDSWCVFAPLLTNALPYIAPQELKMRWLLSAEFTMQALANKDNLVLKIQRYRNHDRFVATLINYIHAGLIVD